MGTLSQNAIRSTLRRTSYEPQPADNEDAELAVAG